MEATQKRKILLSLKKECKVSSGGYAKRLERLGKKIIENLAITVIHECLYQ